MSSYPKNTPKNEKKAPILSLNFVKNSTKKPDFVAKTSKIGLNWRRERDLNPWIHSCITRFRIVRVRPLRHLCIFYRLSLRAGERVAFVVPKHEVLTAPPSLQAVLLYPFFPKKASYFMLFFKNFFFSVFSRSLKKNGLKPVF